MKVYKKNTHSVDLTSEQMDEVKKYDEEAKEKAEQFKEAIVGKHMLITRRTSKIKHLFGALIEMISEIILSDYYYRTVYEPEIPGELLYVDDLRYFVSEYLEKHSDCMIMFTYEHKDLEPIVDDLTTIFMHLQAYDYLLEDPEPLFRMKRYLEILEKAL